MPNQILAERGADKYSSIANEFRRRIAAGELSPGTQLPHRAELEESFQVSKVTMQRVMNLLIEDGFIEATRRKGSFVADRPPHLSRYALAFQGTPGGTGLWTRFWMALVNEAAWRERQDKITLPIFYGIDGHTATEDAQKLNSEIEEHRLAGVIYLPNPRDPDISLLKKLDVPSVAIQSKFDGSASCVTIDYHSFLMRALEWLRARGRKRVAFVCASDFAEDSRDWMQQQAADYGFITHPYWIQGIGLECPMSARSCVHLLMNAAQSEQPDALIITDDNLTEAATAGLLAAGVKVPEAMEIVGHANFPWKTPCLVETRRLGFDVRPILGACLQSIDEQRAGRNEAQFIKMPAQFENELAA